MNKNLNGFISVLLLTISQLSIADTYTYDALNRLTAVSYSNGTSRTYAYDAAGNLLSLGAAQTLQSQTISFAALANQAMGNVPFTISATASSGLTVAFSVPVTTSVCSVSGNAVTLLSAGTCTIAANQIGNGTYAAAPQVLQSFSVVQTAQTISWGATVPSLPLSTAPFSLTGAASSTSGLTITYSSTTQTVCMMNADILTLVAAGTCTIAANQAGDAIYAAATPVSQSLLVTSGSQNNFGNVDITDEGPGPRRKKW